MNQESRGVWGETKKWKTQTKQRKPTTNPHKNCIKSHNAIWTFFTWQPEVQAGSWHRLSAARWLEIGFVLPAKSKWQNPTPQLQLDLWCKSNLMCTGCKVPTALDLLGISRCALVMLHLPLRPKMWERVYRAALPGGALLGIPYLQRYCSFLAPLVVWCKGWREKKTSDDWMLFGSRSKIKTVCSP